MILRLSPIFDIGLETFLLPREVTREVWKIVLQEDSSDFKLLDVGCCHREFSTLHAMDIFLNRCFCRSVTHQCNSARASKFIINGWEAFYIRLAKIVDFWAEFRKLVCNLASLMAGRRAIN